MKNRKAFTLVEVLIAMVLLGIGVIAMVRAGANFTASNKEGADMTTAQFLAEQARERLAGYDFEQLSGFDGDVNSPPIGSDNTPVTELSEYTQQITADYLDPNDFSQVLTSGTSDFIRITVTVSKNGKDITQTSWVRARH